MDEQVQYGLVSALVIPQRFDRISNELLCSDLGAISVLGFHHFYIPVKWASLEQAQSSRVGHAGSVIPIPTTIQYQPYPFLLPAPAGSPLPNSNNTIRRKMQLCTQLFLPHKEACAQDRVKKSFTRLLRGGKSVLADIS